MKVGIIGGGLMGLATAFRLAQKGHQVNVFEKERQPGGLATYHNYGEFIWDRFYHVILPSDNSLVHFLHEVGLEDKIRWKRTFTGFYVDQKCYSMSSALEFLLFPPINLLEKLKLAGTILYCSRIKNWQYLETVPTVEWLVRRCGKNTFKKIWEPLLVAKLGQDYRRASAIFIWSYIKRMFSARNSSAKKEQLGYIEGGYKTLFDRLEKLTCDSGNKIYTHTSIDNIKPHGDGGLVVEFDRKNEHFDKIVFTAAMNDLKKAVSNEVLGLTDRNFSIEYLGIVCMVLITHRPLIPYYILNISDERIPFTGVIGVSSLVPPEETANCYITFFPKYVHPSDQFFQKGDDEISDIFLKGIRFMFPGLKDVEIKGVHIHRALNVQPLQVLNYSNFTPDINTKHKDFFILNSSQFVSDTLNNNSVIRHVDQFIENYFSGSQTSL